MSSRKKYVRGQDPELDAKVDALPRLSPERAQSMSAYALGRQEARIERYRAELGEAGEQRRKAQEAAADGNEFAKMSLPTMEKVVATAFERFYVFSRLQRAAEVLTRRKRRVEGESAEMLVLRLGHRQRGYKAGLAEEEEGPL